MAKKNENAKICSILSYVLIGVIWYFVDEKMKKDKKVKFHATQGLVLFIFWVAWTIIISIIPFIGILWFVPWIFVIIGIINAVNGKQKDLPLIGQFASKFKI